MAGPTQRRPERRQQESGQVVTQLNELAEKLRNVQLTPAQREVVITIIETMARQVTRLPVVIPRELPRRESGTGPYTRTDLEREMRLTPAPGAGSQRSPQARTMPAPRRVEQYVVTIGAGPDARTFLLTPPRPLTAGREREELLQMAGRHGFWGQAPSGPGRASSSAPSPLAEVKQVGGPGFERFNRMVVSGRVDDFEAALNRAGETNTSVSVALSTPPRTRRGG